MSNLKSARVSADGDIRAADYGHIARTILTAAQECDARIVVLGSSSRTDLPYLPFGSMSTRVLHLARGPVLIVPWQETGARTPEQAHTDGTVG